MHIYGVCLADGDERVALYDRLYAVSSPDRRARADRLAGSAEARRCLLAGAMLRYALTDAGYEFPLAADPPLAVGEDGKPQVVGCPDFHYNLSHGGAWVVVAWDNAPVGVDIEPISGARDVRALASRFFSTDEETYVSAPLDAAEAQERFYALWTAKESYLKYTGAGLAHGMATPPLLKDGLITEGVYLTRTRLPDGHWLAVCGASPAGEMQCLSLRDILPDHL